MEVDYAMLIKLYGSPATPETRYSPGEVIGIETQVKSGRPDPKHISTSYVERQNLTMRMSMRRFTRLTNGFSKKAENHVHMLAIYYMYIERSGISWISAGECGCTARRSSKKHLGGTDHAHLAP
jgi:hypothetical protein